MNKATTHTTKMKESLKMVNKQFWMSIKADGTSEEHNDTKQQMVEIVKTGYWINFPFGLIHRKYTILLCPKWMNR